MAGNQLPVTTVINVSVATPQQGLGQYNTSNLAIFSRETYAATFGTLGYKIYLDPSGVATDFGSSSNTFAMANAVFSQQPNILNGSGYLVIIPYLSGAQTGVDTISFPGIPATGTFELTYNSNSTTALAWNASAATIQTALRLVSGLSSVTVTGAIPTAGNPTSTLVVTFVGVSGLQLPLTVTSDSLEDANSVAITPLVTLTVPGSTAETLDQAILRTENLIQYFGVTTAEIPSQAVTLAAAAVIQSLNKVCFFTSFSTADVAPGGTLDLIRSGGFKQSRAVPYFETNALLQPTSSLVYEAGYAGLGLSTNFNGSLTTQTMNLKSLVGDQPDPGMSVTLYNECQSAGADVYASIQGVPKIIISGANDFYDNQYNLQWFVGAVEVAYFNALATVATKIPQTESGMTTVKTSIRVVCEQAVNNGFIAPGSWNSATFFGDQVDLIANIAQRGYYIYSSPVSQQLQAVRVTRAAPLIQIAIKYAGAIQSGTVVIYVNP
jgi:hypothetical protein